MLSDLMRVLERLRKILWSRTEQAYTDRDAQGATDQARSFAAGEANAYGTAEGDVRDAQMEETTRRLSKRAEHAHRADDA